MNNPPSPQSLMLVPHLSADRLSTYLHHCNDDLDLAIALYEWNTSISAALWETIGHVEVVLRNTVATRLAARHVRLKRPRSWLDDPSRELDGRAMDDVADARARLQTKGKAASEGQIISELNFGFWRFLIARRYQTTLWPRSPAASGTRPTERFAPWRTQSAVCTTSETDSPTTSASGISTSKRDTRTWSTFSGTSTPPRGRGRTPRAGSQRWYGPGPRSPSPAVNAASHLPDKRQLSHARLDQVDRRLIHRVIRVHQLDLVS